MKIRGFEPVSSRIEDFNNGKLKLPVRGSAKSAGYDIFNNTGAEIVVEPGEMTPIIKTGIKSYMQDGEYLEIVPRSSMRKTSTRLANTVGVIDSDYYNNSDNEGEIGIFLHNQSESILRIKAGDSFVQGIFKQFLLGDGDSFENGAIRTGGFGSTTGKI